MKKEYDFGTKEPREFRDCLAPFGYVLFILTLLTGYFVADEHNIPEQRERCLRSDVTRFKSNINDSQNYIDTIIKYNYTRPNDPLTGNRIKYYGE